ncbi:MAG TPA: class I SAM-dependent methyltransferase [Bacteroidales bacterium]|nr:class I SAM-dependent methyltransferase [Bacteroidales bacterium]
MDNKKNNVNYNRTSSQNNCATSHHNICRFCKSPLNDEFIDLGMSPLSNAFLKKDQLNKAEVFYPLKVYLCNECLLIQLGQYETPENIFADYVYFSSFSESWLKHSKNYCDQVTERFDLNQNSFVVELASNDGYLLQYFLKKDIPCLGIEPAENVAKVSMQKGIPTISDFFGTRLANELVKKDNLANLVIANNVLAHVPDLNDFVEGIKLILHTDGIATFEFPHFLNLIKLNEFDTIYHEHFSYFSFLTVQKIFRAHELKIFDVEELESHGGSLRIYVSHVHNSHYQKSDRVKLMVKKEVRAGLSEISTYHNFSESAKQLKRDLLHVLNRIKNENKLIVGYGAAAKGNTLFNFCGIRTDYIDYVVDRNPAKQNRYLPGTHIPVYSPDKIYEDRPEYLFIIPWNLKKEIIKQNQYIKNWGGKFIIPIPNVEIIE